MILKRIYIVNALFLLSLNIYSQNIDVSLKNRMIQFLYEQRELNDFDVRFLKENKDNKNVILFWADEVDFNCIEQFKVFKFGTSKEHSQIFLMIVKNKNEIIVLGKDLKNEMREQYFFDFFKFYEDNKIICLYKSLLFTELFEVYQHNINVNSIDYIDLPNVFIPD
ncbi:hypothetical protein HX004_13780 [Myroides sp. 1354]|uniref:hypothetical protein n=1 Tax=unclassified Myroides TaxID=2642485 RepID=UPI002578B59A|nr:MULTISPECIES: hypothetical protein [unclassified Myroides]MDM1044463.1 hypothetical protein [Myroides sp. R163-1]MDM1056836.1 hypothetical protein [Myroides sp. 1354]MDM1069893.1 hypothetical protein [Myroides sp. 1372]